MAYRYDGKELGTFVGTKPKKPLHFYSHVGLETIQSQGNIPTIGKPDIAFSGWLNRKVYRPLVVNSTPYCTDPEQWKPYVPMAYDKKRIYSLMEEKFHLSREALSKRKTMMSQAYAISSGGKKLIRLTVYGKSIVPYGWPGDDNDENGTQWLWFLIEPSSTRYLGSVICGWWTLAIMAMMGQQKPYSKKSSITLMATFSITMILEKALSLLGTITNRILNTLAKGNQPAFQEHS